MPELLQIQFGYKRKITLCCRSDVANTETKRGENSIKISSTHVNYLKNWLNPEEETSNKLSRKSRNRFCTLCFLAGIYGRTAMLHGRNNRFFFLWEQMFFLMQNIFIVPAVKNLYCHFIEGIRTLDPCVTRARLRQLTCKATHL